MINRWFTRYLYGVQNGVESEPKAWVVRETNACPSRAATVNGDQSNTNTLTVADSSQITYGTQVNVQVTSSTGTVSNTTATVVAVPDSTHVVFAAAVATAAGSKVANGSRIGNNITTTPTNSVTCGTNSPTPYAEWPDPGASVAKVNFQTPGNSTGALTFRNGDAANEVITDAPTTTMLTLVNAASNNARLLYKSPVLTQNVRVSGTVHVSLWMSFSKPRANLTAVLVDYPATGTLTSNSTFQERSTRGWLDPQNRTSASVSEDVVPGTFYRMYFDLQPKDMVAVAGRRLAVMIVSSDQESSIRPAAGTQLTMDLSQSWAEIPVVGGATSLATAFGDTAPTVGHTLAPPSPTGSNGWYTGDVGLTWQVNDGGAAVTKTGCVDETFTTDGTFTRSCSATNLLGSSPTDTVTVQRDATAPVTTLTTSPASPDGTNGWFKSSPKLFLAVADGTSGVASTTYSLDGGPPQPYTGPVSGFADGTHTFTFHSSDNAGNVEPTQTYTFTVDTTGPTVTMTVSPAAPDGANGWYLTNPTVSMTASDSTSGIASRELQFEGESDWLPYTGPFQVCGFVIPGKPPVGCKYPPPPPPWGDGHKIDVRATDQAGNTGSDSRVLKVDLDTPVTTATLTPGIHNGWYASPTLTLTGTDGHSGIAHTDYALDGGVWKTYTGPISGFSTGNHFVQFASTDNAGRLEATKLIAFKVDARQAEREHHDPLGGRQLPAGQGRDREVQVHRRRVRDGHVRRHGRQRGEPGHEHDRVAHVHGDRHGQGRERDRR